MRHAVALLLTAAAGHAQAPGDALERLREGDTPAARRILAPLIAAQPGNPDFRYQFARSYLLDFYRSQDPERRRTTLSLAMESLSAALVRNPDHIPSLRAKAVIHARAELLYYDPDLAYRMASRIAELEPNANQYLLGLSDWLSGEVRFSHEGGHRVPHDPLLGLERAASLLNRVLDTALPFSPEETAAYFQMGRTLSRTGKFAPALRHFRQAIERASDPRQRSDTLREMGAAYYRLDDFGGAARYFSEALFASRNPIDRWLLAVAVDRLGKDAPPLPADMVFPTPPRPGGVGEFEDIAPALGLDRLDGNGTCAWGDIDGDGDFDLILAGSGTFLAAYRNEEGRFREDTVALGLGGVPSGYSLNLVDYDNDQRPDLYVTLNGWSGPAKNRLFRNTGGRFTDVTSASGAGDAGSGFVSLFGDLDNDGWLDFAVANGVLKDGSVPRLYRNNRDGTFTDVTRAAGINERAEYGAIGIALGDYDRDGDLDLLINGLDAAPNRLYRNEGRWRFTEVARQAGVTQPPHNGFVCFFLDYNNDGLPDILTTSLAPWEAVVEGLAAGYRPRSASALHPDASRLFRNKGDGTFADVTYEAGLFHPMGTMGAGVADLDNDGYLDLYFGTGDPEITRLEPNRVFRNNGDGTFADWTAAAGIARPGHKGHGVAFVDIDGDGDLEIYAQLGGHYPGDHARNAFYRNLRGSRNHWLGIDLPVGTQVVVRAGGMTLYREVKGSEGFGSTEPPRVHFGLGRNAAAESVEIRWPQGTTRTLRAVAADQLLRLERPASGPAGGAGTNPP